MSYTIEKYKKDIEALYKFGNDLWKSMHFEFKEKDVMKLFKSEKKFTDAKSKLPDFKSEYQSWYSEAKLLVKQLLPDRLDDFIRYYEKPKGRKHISKGLCIIPGNRLLRMDSWQLSTFFLVISGINPENAQLSTIFALFSALFLPYRTHFIEFGRIFPIPGSKKLLS